MNNPNKTFNKYSLILTASGRKWLEQLLEAFGDEDPELMLEHMASGLIEGEIPGANMYLVTAAKSSVYPLRKWSYWT